MSGRIKELVVIKTSHVNGCRYCYVHNTALGQAAGITHDEIVEFTFVSAMFNMINRMNDSLQVPIELQDEVNLIDPAKVQAYVSWVAEFWPKTDFASLNEQAEAAATWPARAAE